MANNQLAVKIDAIDEMRRLMAGFQAGRGVNGTPYFDWTETVRPSSAFRFSFSTAGFACSGSSVSRVTSASSRVRRIGRRSISMTRPAALLNSWKMTKT